MMEEEAELGAENDRGKKNSISCEIGICGITLFAAADWLMDREDLCYNSISAQI